MITKNDKKYKDLDFAFPLNLVTDDVGKKVDSKAINQSLKNLVLSHPFDFPFHPEIGSQVYSLLFEPMTPLTVVALQRAIAYTIDNFEPRVELNDVNVVFDDEHNTLYVTINYTPRNTGVATSYTFEIYRTR